MLNRIDGITILILFVVVSLTGCDRYEKIDMGVVVPPTEWESYEKEVDIGIEAVDILSISQERPVEVLIGAVGSHFNTCVNRDANVYYEREGNTIRLWASMKILDGYGVICGDAVTEAYGEVSVGNLETLIRRAGGDTSDPLSSINHRLFASGSSGKSLAYLAL